MQLSEKRAVLAAISLLPAVGLLAGAGCMLPSLEVPGDTSDADRPVNGDALGSIDGDAGGDTNCDPSTASMNPSDAGADATTSPQFGEVKELIVKNCVECHQQGGQAETTSMIFPSENPSASEISEALKGKASIPSDTPLLDPSKPDNSAIYLRTKEDNPPEMPTEGGWSGDEAESENTLKNWIAAGAQIPTCN